METISNKGSCNFLELIFFNLSISKEVSLLVSKMVIPVYVVSEGGALYDWIY